MLRLLISVEGRGHSGKSTVLEQFITRYAERTGTAPTTLWGAQGDQLATFDLSNCRRLARVFQNSWRGS